MTEGGSPRGDRQIDDLDVPGALAGMRLDRAVAFLGEVTRAEAGRLVDEGAVSLGGAVVTDRSRRLKEHEKLSVESSVLAKAPGELSPAPSGAVPFEVLYEDDELIVVDKPAGVVVHEGAGHERDTLVAGLLARYPDIAGLPSKGAGEAKRPGIVHRLDKDTSGVLAVARTPRAFASLSGQLAQRTMGRRYLAIVLGHLEARSGVIDAPIGRSSSDPTRMAVSAGGRAARTGYEVRAQFSDPLPASYLELKLETGRTHQIRVHTAAVGHPVLGDRRYGGRRGALAVSRPMLHAWRLAFLHPLTGVEVVVESLLPADFQAVLDRLG